MHCLYLTTNYFFWVWCASMFAQVFVPGCVSVYRRAKECLCVCVCVCLHKCVSVGVLGKSTHSVQMRVQLLLRYRQQPRQCVRASDRERERETEKVRARQGERECRRKLRVGRERKKEGGGRKRQWRRGEWETEERESKGEVEVGHKIHRDTQVTLCRNTAVITHTIALFQNLVSCLSAYSQHPNWNLSAQGFTNFLVPRTTKHDDRPVFLKYRYIFSCMYSFL